jgi:hypothetical protein
MLGVRRTSVTEVAIKVQDTGAISYSRGHIKILDLDALKAMSCECYQTLREEKIYWRVGPYAAISGIKVVLPHWQPSRWTILPLRVSKIFVINFNGSPHFRQDATTGLGAAFSVIDSSRKQVDDDSNVTS